MRAHRTVGKAHSPQSRTLISRIEAHSLQGSRQRSAIRNPKSTMHTASKARRKAATAQVSGRVAKEPMPAADHIEFAFALSNERPWKQREQTESRSSTDERKKTKEPPAAPSSRQHGVPRTRVHAPSRVPATRHPSRKRAYVVNGAKNRTTTHDMTTSIFGSQSDASIPPNQPTNHIPQSHTHPLVSRETNDEEEQIPDRPSFRTPGIDDHSGAPSAWSARCVYAVVVILRRLVGARPAFVLSRVCVLR